MLNKCEQNNNNNKKKKRKQKQIRRKTSQANEILFFFRCLLLFKRRHTAEQKKTDEKYQMKKWQRTIYAKILEHDEMQILLQIAIIISEWTQCQTTKEKRNVRIACGMNANNGRIVFFSFFFFFPVTDRDRTRFKMTLIILMFIINVVMRIEKGALYSRRDGIHLHDGSQKLPSEHCWCYWLCLSLSGCVRVCVWCAFKKNTKYFSK